MRPAHVLALGTALLLSALPLQNCELDDGQKRELCAKNGRQFLIGGLEGGLNNQKWGISILLALAKKYRLTWVAPRLDMEYFRECGGQMGLSDISQVYNMEVLYNFTRANDINIMMDITKGLEDNCCHDTHTFIQQTGQNPNMTELRDKFPLSATCLHSFPVFYYMPNEFMHNDGGTSAANARWHLNWPDGDLYRTGLQPSNFIVHQVHKVMQYLVETYAATNLRTGKQTTMDGLEDGPYSYWSWRRQWPVAFTTVHARLEDDWEPHCGRFAKRDRLKCYYSEQMIQAYLLDDAKLEKGSLLQVASAVSIAELPTLCATFKCFKVSDIVATMRHKDLGDCITREMYGAIEFWVASYAKRFYGNLHSSFTVEALATFRMLGKTAAYYNGECASADDPDCQ